MLLGRAFRADRDRINSTPKSLTAARKSARRGGCIAAIGEDDDAGETLALEIFHHTADAFFDLGVLADGFEFIQGAADGFGSGVEAIEAELVLLRQCSGEKAAGGIEEGLNSLQTGRGILRITCIAEVHGDAVVDEDGEDGGFGAVLAEGEDGAIEHRDGESEEQASDDAEEILTPRERPSRR